MEIYIAGILLFGIPLAVMFFRASAPQSIGDGILVGILLLLITTVWPVSLFWFVQECRSVEDADEEDINNYMFHKWTQKKEL